MFLLCTHSVRAQNVTLVSTSTTSAPSPSFGCAYTAMDDDRLARGVAVPLRTCIESPIESESSLYECHPNKTHVIRHFYSTSATCNASASPVFETQVGGVECLYRYIWHMNPTVQVDFECDGDPCPSVDFVLNGAKLDDDGDCIDTGHTLGIGSYVVDRCTFYQNFSAMVTCDKSSIMYVRYNGTSRCEEIRSGNASAANNVRVARQELGCQYRVNAPSEPNGWIASIACPGDAQSSGDDANTVAIIVGVTVGSLVLLTAAAAALYCHWKHRKMRKCTEVTEKMAMLD